MKASLISYVLLAVSSANAAAIPSASPEAAAAPEGYNFCHKNGEACNKLKRAAAAAAEAIAEPGKAHFCHIGGEPCTKAKRSLDDLKTLLS